MKKTSHVFWRLLYKLHRYIGLLISLVLLMLAVTGIALNHTEELQLDSRFIQNTALLDWYRIKPPKPKRVFKVQNGYLSQFDNQIYLNQSVVLKSSETLQGAVANDMFIAAALENTVVLLSAEGDVIEQTAMATVEQIGINAEQQIFIKQAGKVLLSDDGLLTWQEAKNQPIQWSASSTLPKSLENAIQTAFRGAILPMERILLDIHSGRFFGKAGVFIVDACGVLLIVLIFSGCAIWLKHKLRALLHSKKKTA